MIGKLAAVTLLAALGCSTASPEPASPGTPTRALGLRFEPGPCVEGPNTVSASAFVTSAAQIVRYLEPADGEFRLDLLRDGVRAGRVKVRWLEVAPASNATLATLTPNLELVFDGPRAGACAIQVEFTPSSEAAKAGLGPALSTIMLKDAPAPPGLEPAE